MRREDGKILGGGSVNVPDRDAAREGALARAVHFFLSILRGRSPERASLRQGLRSARK